MTTPADDPADRPPGLLRGARPGGGTRPGGDAGPGEAAGPGEDRGPGEQDGAAAAAGPPVAGLVMGSDSDWPVMEAAASALAEFGVSYEVDVVSAHRMPHEMLAYGASAEDRGLRVLIAGAGGAAHLPGMLAAVTPLPVIGVPVPLAHLDGLDSLLSIVSMPAGVPVATVAVGGARNAGLLAVRILGAGDPALRERMARFQENLREQAKAKGAALRARRDGAAS